MAEIHERWGGYISGACHSSSIPPEFLATLIANESGGDNEKPPRFEPGVYLHLAAVQKGTASPGDVLHHRPAHFGSILKGDLNFFTDENLRAFASSWGLTQIMGYHLLKKPWSLASAQWPVKGDPNPLLDPAFNLHQALKLLGGFAQEFQLDPRLEYEEMFRCWNSGRPDGKTFDPHYVENGLARIEIYKKVASGQSLVVSGQAER
jgi:hypothetical protein